ncbi:uncharacterized protein LOC131679770 [Topomyia yanbarensis]|uniref:uncharacterized protein LOC131679770 n=1 Tax=Topomyia yanbarensis TaxID=2498891 RepID=UPI00273B0C4F|nr:uncharacterized protein LOC131679770 [Topomyia yanbarensis]
MYRMVLLHEADRDYQRILWRWSNDEPMNEYRLHTVTYGTKSASYLATKCVQQLLLSFREQYPQAVEKASKGTYVDDLLVGADNIDEAKRIRSQLSDIFDSGGFHLRKWASNDAAALEGLPETDRELKMPIEIDDSNTIKALGIHWQPCSDELHFSYQPSQILQPTKRTILSQIASLFDRLGLLAPIIVKAKLVMQRLWELKVAWDATPPGELVALAWINGGASRWKTFVANRVAEAVTYLPAINWGHVDTHLYPADLISRGMIPEQLKDNKLWWDGPPWNPKSGHDTVNKQLNTNQQQQINREQKATVVSLVLVYKNTFLDDMRSRYYPNLQKLLRVTARMLRFHCRESRQTTTLTPKELNRALEVYLKHVQQQHYYDELQRLHQHKDVKRQSTLFQLKPFLDERGLLRVGGRIEQSNLQYDTKHPLLLPRNSILTFLVLHRDHIMHHHCGPQTLLAASRSRFWIIRGPSVARKVYRQCIVCARAKPAPIDQQMGQLPADRVQPHPPFLITGVDYAGPVSIVGRRARGAVASKGYIALFVCFSTKAVHLEAVSDLSTSAFLAAFTRFSSRYGLPAKMFSDNATNFRAASKQLQELYRLINSANHNQQVANFLADKGVVWNFIPARSPHHGGLWESAIKGAKHLLGKIAGNQHFTFEELSTFLAQVSETMNSRQITPISNDAHFLIGRALTTVPEINMLEHQISSLSRWSYIQRLSQEFRSRWQLEYVRSLQRFTKWQQSSPNIAVGDFVILVKDDEKPRQWPLGRILETFPGPDGLVRVVSVRTATGITRRDVRRLRVVPLDKDEYVPGRLGTEIPNRNLTAEIGCTAIRDSSTYHAVPPGVGAGAGRLSSKKQITRPFIAGQFNPAGLKYTTSAKH